MKTLKPWTHSFPYGFTIGDHVVGHVCHSCMEYVDKPTKENNPRITDWCMICHHRGEGYRTTGKVADWFRIIPTT